MLVLASSGCVTALHVTTAATVVDGEVASPFALPAQDGTQVSLAKALADGPVVLVFYRGYW
jgi:peroxiredoxin